MRISERLFLVLLLFSALCCYRTEAASGNSAQIGYINSARILQEYPKAQQLLKDLAKAEADLNKKILVKREEIKKARAQKKTETEIQMLAEKIKLELEPQAKKLEEESARKSREIESKVNETIKSVASKGKYDVVFAKEAVLYGGKDLTNEVLSKLK